MRASVLIGWVAAAGISLHTQLAAAVCVSNVIGVRVDQGGLVYALLRARPGPEPSVLLCDLSVNSASCSAWLSLAEAAHLSGRKLLLRMTDYAITCEDIPLAPEIVYITLHEEPIR